MRIKLDYDRSSQTVDVPDRNLLGVIGARSFKDAQGAPRLSPAQALASPVGSPRLGDMVEKGQRVAIAASGSLKPPALPSLVEIVWAELEAKGVPDSNVTVILGKNGCGPRPESAITKMVGRRVKARLACQWADPADYLRLGRTKSGTPVDVTAAAVEAGKVVSLGAIGYDMFAGYTGGAETIIPQMAGSETVESLLRLSLKDGAEPGRIQGNPLREEIEEAARLLPLDFVLDVVLDGFGRVVMATAGHPEAAHRKGLAFLDERMAIEAAEPASIVLASCGGAPFDRSLESSLEILARIKPLAAPEGIVILLAACPEGAGDSTMREWLSWADHPLSIMNRAALCIKPGGHLAAALARIVTEIEVFLVAEPILRSEAYPLLHFFPTAEAALREALARRGHGASIWVLPKARDILPRLKAREGQ